jgi:hypothetical protein
MALKSSTFKVFPEFSRLTMDDKDAYESFVKDYPPLTDISFAGLMIWWNFLDNCAISQLNGNLVLSYWLAGDEKNTGLSLIGKEDIDETVCEIFDHLKTNNEPVRLVHVPEFVVSNMRYPEMFNFTGEQDYDECIFAISGFYPLSHATKRAKQKIQGFLSKTPEDSIEIKSLDLWHETIRRQLIDGSRKWRQKGNFNDLGKLDNEAFRIAVDNAQELDIENICLFIDGELAGFQLYQIPSDRRYVIGTFTKVDCDIPGAAEYMFYAAAKHYADLGAAYINYEQDLGIPSLRAEKLALGPANFFRKYTIRPIA